MFKGTRILIWSENPDELMKFYRDVLKLEIEEKTDIPEKDGIAADYGYMFLISDKGEKVWIGRHSEVKGISKEPVRIMHNLYSDDVQMWYETVRDAGCKILCEPTKTPFYSDRLPWYVSTFLDPEGNSWQFMGTLKSSQQ
ncbi:MAG TPA: VOC family protein [Candidatus Dojkabacteria bacterium]|nr:VOC family protein [Candidatus Dojkabacteria bacterium]